MKWYDVIPQAMGETAGLAEMLDCESVDSQTFLDVDEMADVDMRVMPTVEEIEDSIDDSAISNNLGYVESGYQDSDFMEAWDIRWFKQMRKEHEERLKIELQRLQSMSLRDRLIARGIIKPATAVVFASATVPTNPTNVQPTQSTQL